VSWSAESLKRATQQPRRTETAKPVHRLDCRLPIPAAIANEAGDKQHKPFCFHKSRSKFNSDRSLDTVSETQQKQTVASHIRLLPLYQGFRVKPSGLLSLVRPTGSRTEGRPMRVNDRLRMEVMAECLGKQPAFLMQERP